MFGNWLSWLHHKLGGQHMQHELQITFWTKTILQQQLDGKTFLNMLLSSSIKSLDLATNPPTIIAHAWIVKFNTSRIIVRKGIITFASYLKARQI